MFENTRYMQYLGAISATMSIMSGTVYVTWSSPTLPLLTSEDSPIGHTLTDNEASWVVSIFSLAGLPIAPIVPYMVDKFGRKGILLISGIFMFFPWFLIIFANSVWMLYIGRALGGMGQIMATTGTTIYNGEIADVDIRGRLGTMFTLMKLVGQFVVLSVGPFVSYTTLAIICASFPVLFTICFVFMPESPYYLIKVGKKEQAKDALIKFSAKNVSSDFIEKRMLDIKNTIEIDNREKVTVCDFFGKVEYRKSLLIMAGVKTLQNFSGTSPIEAYMQSIIESTSSSISPEVSSILCGAMQFVGALLAAIFIDRLGRKPILIISAFVCAVCLSGEGAYFFLQDYKHSDVSSLSWLPTTAIVTFLVSSNFGVLNLPFVLLGELFPTNIKSAAVTAITFYSTLLAFLVSKTFSPMTDAWGNYTVFWIYASCCMLGIMFVFVFLPETKGKTFDEIQEKINGKKNVKTETKTDINDVRVVQ